MASKYHAKAGLWISRMRMRWYLHVTVKWKWLKGECWCRFRHRPLFRGLGGWGGRDVWGRKREAYSDMRCLVCRNLWQTMRPHKPLTRAQNQACAEVFGTMWVGDKGTAAEIGEKVMGYIIQSGLCSVDSSERVIVWSGNAASQIGEMVCREVLHEERGAK